MSVEMPKKRTIKGIVQEARQAGPERLRLLVEGLKDKIAKAKPSKAEIRKDFLELKKEKIKEYKEVLRDLGLEITPENIVTLAKQEGLTKPIVEIFKLLEVNFPKVLERITSESAKSALRKSFTTLTKMIRELRQEIVKLDTDIATMVEEKKSLKGSERSEMVDKIISKQVLRDLLKSFEKNAASERLHDLMYKGEFWTAEDRQLALAVLVALREARDRIGQYRKTQTLFAMQFMDNSRIKNALEDWLTATPDANEYLQHRFEGTPDVVLKNLEVTIGLKKKSNPGGRHPFKFYGIDYSVADNKFEGNFEQPVAVYLSEDAMIAAGKVDFAQEIETQLRMKGLPVNSNVMKVLIFGTKEEAHSLLEWLLTH